MIQKNKLDKIILLKGKTTEVERVLESAHLVLQITHQKIILSIFWF